MAIYLKVDNVKGSVSAENFKGYVDVFNYHVEHFRQAEQISGREDKGTVGLNKHQRLR